MNTCPWCRRAFELREDLPVGSSSIDLTELLDAEQQGRDVSQTTLCSPCATVHVVAMYDPLQRLRSGWFGRVGLA
jgi:hypothetical protein